MVEESCGTAAAPIAVSTALHGGGLGPDTGGTLGAVSEERKDERCLLIVCGIVHNVHAAIIQEIWQVVEESRGRGHGAYRASSGLVEGGLEGTWEHFTEVVCQ